MSNTIAQHEGQGQARAGTPPKEGDSPAPTDANVGATLVVARVEREGMTLPQGWAWANVEQLAESIQYGYTESAQTEPIGPKFLRITDIQNGRVNWDTVPYCKCSEEEHQKYRLQPGDIVFARTGATTGKSYLISSCPDAVFASYLIRLRVSQFIDTRYFALFFDMPGYWSQIMRVRKGSAQPGVNATILATLRVPVSPLAEQRRIVAEIEKQFTRLDAGVAALKRVQANLKRYKASVLKAACEGKLVEQDPNDEPASELLARILEQRKGAVTASQRRHVEPAPPDTDGLPELPHGWCWANLGLFAKAEPNTLVGRQI